MRKLVWFTVGFSIACTAGAYLLSSEFLILLAVLSSIVAVFCVFWRSKWKICAVFAAGLLGCAVGFSWFSLYDHLYISSAREHDGKTVYTSAEICDYSYDTDYGVAADGKLMLDGKPYQVRLYLPKDTPLEPGDIVMGALRLRFTGKEGSGAPTYHQGSGIFLLAYADADTVVLPSQTEKLRYTPSILRRSIEELLTYLFPEDTFAFAQALLLGETSGLSYEEDTALKISGIRHVVAVSGLHVSILFSFLYQFCGKRRVLTAVLGLPILFLFAAIAGFSPSVVRACIMQSLMILALLFNREYDPPTALAFAVLVMLLLNPITITSVSFQLSAGCIVGILLFSDRINTYLMNEKRLGRLKSGKLSGRIVRWLSGSISVSVSAMLITVPFSAYYFNMVSLISVFTNLLTLWLVSFVFYGIMAACAIGAVLFPAGHLIAEIISGPIRYILAAARTLSEIPFAALYTESIYVVLWLVLSYLLLAVFLLAKRKRVWLLACCIGITLLLSIMASWLEPKFDNYRISVLDVGQGQCIILQHDEKCFLIDCGGDTDEIAADKAAQALHSQGITRLNGVFLTHFDKDHAGGINLLLSRVDAEKLYLPDISKSSQLRNEISMQSGEKITWISKESRFQFGDLLVTLFPGYDTDDSNESGMFILFRVENCDILITGDQSSRGERLLVEQVQLPELELLVVGHHGSNDATCFEFLAATRPQNAVISVAADNSYGHPHADVLKRLYLCSCKVRRTDQDGTVLYRG